MLLYSLCVFIIDLAIVAVVMEIIRAIVHRIKMIKWNDGNCKCGGKFKFVRIKEDITCRTRLVFECDRCSKMFVL